MRKLNKKGTPKFLQKEEVDTLTMETDHIIQNLYD
jgi:hypothetical protein